MSNQSSYPKCINLPAPSFCTKSKLFLTSLSKLQNCLFWSAHKFTPNSWDIKPSFLCWKWDSLSVVLLWISFTENDSLSSRLILRNGHKYVRVLHFLQSNKNCKGSVKYSICFIKMPISMSRTFHLMTPSSRKKFQKALTKSNCNSFST